jgi:hypothetical protein
MVIVDNIEYRLSKTKGKKLDAFVNNKWIPFGSLNYSHYYDRTKLLNPNMNHLDEERRVNYLKRASKIRDKNNKLTVYNINSPNHHAIRILW